MKKLYDASGKVYYLVSGEGSTIHLKDGQGNIIHVPAGELCKRYSGYPPEVHEAFNKLKDMVDSGETTWDEIRKLAKALPE
jgi:hypothetical protein